MNCGLPPRYPIGRYPDQLVKQHYLVAILDWYSRYVVSWEMDQTLELSFVLTALQRALEQAVPVICNSDQGSH
jgi:transposase InsO family protein